MHQKMASIAQVLRLTAVCALCNQYHREQFAICKPCLELISPLTYACSICRLPLPNNSLQQCGYCIRQKPVFDYVLAAYSFDEPLRTLIHNFKYHQALHLKSLLAKLMLDALPTSPYRPDCLIPIPMHPNRLYQRGFNQTVELTKLLAKRLAIPMDLNVVHKKINTLPQASLSGAQRRRNLKSSFIAKPNPYQHVTIIDDLMTTGSTANEVARLLKKQQIEHVDIWCLARATI
ncbi:competence protein ComF [Legionella beliardensis]|uniref:Competence protein ComF n=1 Tax=Legionella beliardensis TaxID=91822 RepID=A0A378I2S9_9GAMM|nr:ComF family protein [Legionella beliardensis]STX29468.1 competence protein ComF [Legionella beliardensis]